VQLSSDGAERSEGLRAELGSIRFDAWDDREQHGVSGDTAHLDRDHAVVVLRRHH
jgi:hypothetical protein